MKLFEVDMRNVVTGEKREYEVEAADKLHAEGTVRRQMPNAHEWVTVQVKDTLFRTAV